MARNPKWDKTTNSEDAPTADVEPENGDGDGEDELNEEMTHEQIDAYAAAHDIELPKGNLSKADKIAFIQDNLDED